MVYNKYIYALVEAYTDSTEQMNKTLKDAKKYQKAAEEAKESRKKFICEILGTSTYNKMINNDRFAPISLNALKIDRKDFDNMSPSFGEDRTDKFIEKLQIKYYRNDFALKDDGFGNQVLNTDVVFRTMNDIIDFFYALLACYIKTYRTEDIVWKPIVKKFRAYLKTLFGNQ